MFTPTLSLPIGEPPATISATMAEDPPEKKMNTYLAVHTFKSLKVKEYILDLNVHEGTKGIGKHVTTPTAKCGFTMIPLDSDLNQYCYWKAESPQAIYDALDQNNLTSFYFTTLIMPCHEIRVFHPMYSTEPVEYRPIG